MPEAGGERPYVTPVNPGQFIDLATDQGQVFAFSDGQNWVGGLYSVAEASQQTISLPISETGNARATASAQGNRSLNIRVENSSGQTLQIHTVSADGASAPVVGQVAGGSFAEITGAPGQVIGVSDAQNWVGGQYTVTADANQTVKFPLDPNAEAAATANNTQSQDTLIVRLRNPTNQDYQVHVISPDRSQAPLVGTAKAQFANDLPFLPGQTLGFSDGKNWVGDQYVVTAEAGQVLTLPYSQAATATQGSAAQADGNAGGGQSAASGQPANDAATNVTVRIENPTAQALQVHVIPPNGADAPVVGQVNAGVFIDLPASPGMTFGFSDGNNWIGETYVVAAAPNQTISLPFAGGGARNRDGNCHSSRARGPG